MLPIGVNNLAEKHRNRPTQWHNATHAIPFVCSIGSINETNEVDPSHSGSMNSELNYGPQLHIPNTARRQGGRETRVILHPSPAQTGVSR